MDDNSDSELPRVVELLLGARDRPRRGPKPALSLERIIQAAIHAADAEGLAALSMGRVAEELGVTPMALYRYVGSKDELLMLMVDGVPGEPPAVRAGDDWRAGLTRWAQDLGARYRRHPWVLQVPITGPPILPGGLAWMDHGLRALADTGLTEGEKLAVIQLLTVYVYGEAQLAHQLTQAASAARESGDAAGGAAASYGDILRRMIDVERHPALSRVLAAGVFDESTDYSDADLEFGLHRVLDGIEVLIRAREHE